MKASILRLADRTGTPSLTDAAALALAELSNPDALPAAEIFARVPMGATAVVAFAAALGRPGADDRPLVAAAPALGLEAHDLAALALARATDADPVVPALLRLLQGEAFGPWPSRGLLVRVLDRLGVAPRPVPAARVFELGCLERIGERAPVAEERFGLSPPLRWIFRCGQAEGFVPRAPSRNPVPEPWRRRAREIAGAVGGRRVRLALRGGERDDRLRFAGVLAEALALQMVEIGFEPGRGIPGLGAAAEIGRWLPVERLTVEAGRRAPLMPLPGYVGPRCAVLDGEGGLEAEGAAVIDMAPPALSARDRGRLWAEALGDEPPEGLAALRFGPARIAAIGARMQAAPDAPASRRLRSAMGEDLRADMEPHALHVPDHVDEADFVAGKDLAMALDLLVARCQFKDAPGRRAVGVRALLHGPSGTGKTLACARIATRLGLPLFKLDLGAVTSKWIGETEENLGRLLARAENAAMIILIDEADSLFGARTDARDGTDRFANNQTNYLLSRIERFDGIVFLTTNARERIDAAFLRRIDQSIEVPLPAPPERRAIWRAHLGPGHALSGRELNRLAGLVDLAGGHIRSITETAAILAASERRAVAYADVLVGVEHEYRKLDRSPPGGLRTP